MRLIWNTLVLVAVLFEVSCSEPAHTATTIAKKKVILIPGADSHGVGEHEHLGGCELLAQMLNRYVPEIEAIVSEQTWPKDTSILENADAIVMYSDGGARHMVIPHIDHIDRLMKKGVGLVNIHYAVEIPAEQGKYFKDWVGGYFETHWSVNPFWTANFKSFPEHPTTRGVKPFAARDEWYYHMRFADDEKNIIPVLSDLPPDSTLTRPDGPHSGNAHVRDAVLRDKKPQTVAWAYTRNNGGKGFSFTGAHVHSNWQIDGFRKIILNAIVWSAGVEVPKNGIETPAPGTDVLTQLQKSR